MATLTAPPRKPQEGDELDPERRHFEGVVGEASSPSSHATQESPDEDEAVKHLRDQESGGGGRSPKDNRPVDNQEETPYKFRNGQEVYDRSKQAKEDGKADGRKRKRGIFIGIGAGGGVISVFAGLLTLLPFKMPALMDFINDRAGQRVEDIVEHESEKIMLRFFLHGSRAALANGDVIVTGNPIGDLFANLRIARFEDTLFKESGLKIEPNGKGGIRIFHNGADLGDFKKESEIREFLNRTDLKYGDSRKAIKLLVKEKIPAWRWIKRMKYAKYLRLKFIPFLGVGQRKPDESNEDFEKRARSIEAETINGENTERAGKFMECVSDPSCEDVDKRVQEDIEAKSGSVDGERAAQQIDEATDKAAKELIEHEADHLVTEGVETIAKQGSSKLATLLGAGAATAGVLAAVDLITIAANIDHWIANNVDNGKLIKTIAYLRGGAYATFYAFFAGVGDQAKAGEMEAAMMGMFSDQFNHVTESAAYNVMDSGEVRGEDVESFRKPNGAAANSEWAKLYDQMYNGPMIALRAPLIGWYYTIGWIWNHLTGLIGKGVGWIIENVPCAQFVGVVCPKQLLAEMSKLFGPLWDWFMNMFGLSIDAFTSDALSFTYAAYGGQVSYDGYCKQLDCHELSPASARESAQRIARENAEYTSGLSFADRMFSLDNTRSLASALVRTMPSLSPMKGGFGSLVFAGARLASGLPGNIANIMGGRAHAASGDGPSLDQMMNNPDIGVDSYELEQEISPVLQSGGTCTVNNDAHYDNCEAGMEVIDSINCSISVVSLCKDGGPPTGDTSNNAPATTLPEGTGAKLAQMILDNPNITFEGTPPNYPGDGAHNDLLAMATGKPNPISPCGKAISIDSRLMQVLLAAAGNYTDPKNGQKVPSHYKFRINALASDHSCNQGYHPRGEAADLGWVNGVYAGPDVGCPNNGCGLSTDLYKQFATFFGKNLPPGGEMGQKQCLGKLDIPAGFDYNNDTCHHLHVASGD